MKWKLQPALFFFTAQWTYCFAPLTIPTSNAKLKYQVNLNSFQIQGWKAIIVLMPGMCGMKINYD